MITIETALELSRQRLAEATERASLFATLGEVPAARPLFPFRRRNVVSLAGIVEVRRTSDKDRIRRRLLELSTAAPARGERKAS